MITETIFVLLIFLYALLSERVSQTSITAPILFTAAGMVMSPAWAHIAGAGVTSNVFLRVAELGLVLLLFTDAGRKPGISIYGRRVAVLAPSAPERQEPGT